MTQGLSQNLTQSPLGAITTIYHYLIFENNIVSNLHSINIGITRIMKILMMLPLHGFWKKRLQCYRSKTIGTLSVDSEG